ncbi:MAG: patatin-like phospholipase family protein [Proteobacteria bacterium]|nr:patatin-like phospholipase family protein [Pseudomonadota bacterium]
MTRALVLGGGGPVGIAWESGLIAGLAQGGVDLSAADFTMGTSAGSFVGARLALGADPKTLADPILADRIPGEEGRPAGGGGPPPDLSKLMALMAEAQGGVRNPAEVRAEIGAFALAAQTMDEQAFLDSFGKSFSTLPVDAWPQRGFACTAVDAETGAFQLWTQKSGVGVVRAVASSCSVPGVYPPVTLNGRRYIDGGMRSSTNADVAIGHDLVLVVALRLGGAGGAVGDRIAARLDEEVESLKDGGATVLTITPDEASVEAFGVNLMDFRRRPDAARAGLAQGQAYARDVKPYWS